MERSCHIRTSLPEPISGPRFSGGRDRRKAVTSWEFGDDVETPLHHRYGGVSRRPAAGFAILLLIGIALPPARSASGDGFSIADRIVFLIQYVGLDYRDAVRDGEIVDPFEFREGTSFERRVTVVTRPPGATTR